MGRDCEVGTPFCAPCEDRCRVYKAYLEILARQGGRLGAISEQVRLFEPVKVSTEGLDRQKDRWATTSNPKALVIHVEGPSSGGSAVGVTSLPTPQPTAGPIRKLSKEEIDERILRLETKHKQWLDLARPLLTEEELERFLQLSSREKDAFIEDFWKRRS